MKAGALCNNIGPGGSRCYELAVKGGRCAAHQAKWASTSHNGSTRTWRKVRAAALKRDGGRCVICGTPSNEVDHIVNRANGGRDVLSNAQVLCAEHHRVKTNTEAAEGRAARRVMDQ